MTEIKYYTTKGAVVDTVVVFNPTGSPALLSANSNHPNFDEIVVKVAAGNPEVFELFDVKSGIQRQFKRVTERVSWDGNQVLWDGDPIDSLLADQIARSLDAGTKNFEPLAKFWEKLESNPSKHSRDMAYEWLATHRFSITVDGDVVGYKGVVTTGTGTYTSYASSKVPDKPSAFVDGKPVAPLSRVPNQPGTVVTLPRSEVVHDPSLTCHRGLHISTYSYSKSFGDATMLVTFNPRDLVSTPTGAAGEKVRVCAYKAEHIVNGPLADSPVLSADSAQWVPDVSYKG